MTTLTNNFEGGTSGTTLTTGNTGAPSGNAFDAITVTGSGAALTFSNSQAAHGSLSAELIFPASTSSTSYASWTTSMGSKSEIWFRMYLYHTANPTVQIRIWQADQSGSTLCGALYLTTGGKLLMGDSGGSNSIESTNTVPLSAWYRVEGFLVGSASVGQLSFSLYESMDSGTATETQTSMASFDTTGSPNSYRFGSFAAVTESSTWDLWMDDIGLSSTGYLGSAGPATRNIHGIMQAVNRGAWGG